MILIGLLAGVTTAPALADDHPAPAKAPFNAQQAQEFQQRWAEHIGKETVFTNSIGMKVVLIPPGEFVMGNDEAGYKLAIKGMLKGSYYERMAAQRGFNNDEEIAHRVRLNKPFYMGACEVTVGQFRQFAEDSGYKTEAERGLVYGQPYKGKAPIRTWRKTFYKQPDDHPVLQVNWNDAVAFCKWLTDKENAREGEAPAEPRATNAKTAQQELRPPVLQYCLPTEAQWEYACRAGTTTFWYFGEPDDYDKLVDQYEWITGKKKTPSAVGLKKPNRFGLYDMHGSVMEWVADWHHWYFYLESPVNDPIGPPTENELKHNRGWVRGGMFKMNRYWSTSHSRMRIHRGSNQHDHVGFRVAMKMKDVKGLEPPTEPYMRPVVRKGSAQDEKIVVTKEHAPELSIDLSETIKMEFVLVQPGAFMMGSTKGGGFERPVHRVIISRPFYVGRYEVTQGQWDAILGKEDRLKRWGKAKLRPTALGPNKPMGLTSWNDWQEFVRALRKKVRDSSRSCETSSGEAQTPTSHEFDYEFSLPTEAQWEYACRAGSTTAYCFGDDPAELKEYAWICAEDALPPREREWPDLSVGGKKPNNWGIHDMHGSVWEWCTDWWDKEYYSKSPPKDPQGPETGTFRVMRGGVYTRYGRFARSAFRYFMPPNLADHATGARLVINLYSLRKEKP